MKFHILDDKGNAVSNNKLDEEACKLWSKEVDKKHYTNPYPIPEGLTELQELRIKMRTNWYDQIGWVISNKDNNVTTWVDVVHVLIDDLILNSILKKDEGVIKLDSSLDEVRDVLEWAQPYVDLINHWSAKGYTPKRVEDY